MTSITSNLFIGISDIQQVHEFLIRICKDSKSSKLIQRFIKIYLPDSLDITK